MEATLDDLKGHDLAELAALARSDARKIKERLKEIGITTMGARTRLITQLLAYQGGAAPAATRR